MKKFNRFLRSLLSASISGRVTATIIDPQEKELNAALARLSREIRLPVVRLNDRANSHIADVSTLIDGCQRYMQLYHHERLRAQDAEHLLAAERAKNQ